MIRFLARAVLMLAMVVGLVTPFSPAAHAATLSADERAAIVAQLIAYSVPSAAQVKLLDKLEAGQPWDSMSSTAVPVRIERYHTVSEQGTLKRFADGSIILTSMSNPTIKGSAGVTATAAGSLSGCSIQRYSYAQVYSGCVAKVSSVLLTLRFAVSFTTTSSGGQINGVGPGYAQALGGTFAKDSVYPDVPVSQGWPARAMWTGTFTYYPGWSSKDVWLKLDAWSSFSVEGVTA